MICDNNVEKRTLHVIFHIFNSQLILVENMKHCNANKITIADTEEKQIDQAFDVGAVKTVKERNAEAEANAPK